MLSQTASGKIRTDTPVRARDGAGCKPPHEHCHQQPQSHPQHLQRMKTWMKFIWITYMWCIMCCFRTNIESSRFFSVLWNLYCHFTWSCNFQFHFNSKITQDNLTEQRSFDCIRSTILTVLPKNCLIQIHTFVLLLTVCKWNGSIVFCLKSHTSSELNQRHPALYMG